MPTYITVHCCAFSNGSVGGTEWRRAKKDADAQFRAWKEDPDYDTDTLIRFDMEVPVNMPNEMITHIVGGEVESLLEQECIEIRRPVRTEQ